MSSDNVSIAAGQPCGRSPHEVELQQRAVIIAQMVLSLWCLGLLGSLALGVTFLAGGDDWASLLCLWVFGGFLALGVISLVSARVAVRVRAWGGDL